MFHNFAKDLNLYGFCLEVTAHFSTENVTYCDLDLYLLTSTLVNELHVTWSLSRESHYAVTSSVRVRQKEQLFAEFVDSSLLQSEYHTIPQSYSARKWSESQEYSLSLD